MPSARYQCRHGAMTEYEANKSGILPNEIVIVDSGADTDTGSEIYYKPLGATEPVRLAHASEVSDVLKNLEIDAEISKEWGDEIPPTYEGALGQIVFYIGYLWVCDGISERAGTRYYSWSLLATLDDIDNKEDVSNKTTILSSLSTHQKYPSAKCVYDAIKALESRIEALET